MTFADRLLLYAMVGAAAVLLLTGGGREEGTSVRILGDSGFTLTAPIGSARTVEVEGPLGTTVVEIADGGARIVSSPCSHRLCVRMGAVRTPGRTVVCVPNRVVVTVEGEGPEPTDAVTR